MTNDAGKFFKQKMDAINPNNLPTAVGISWYKEENYSALMDIFEDSDNLPDSYAGWPVRPFRAGGSHSDKMPVRGRTFNWGRLHLN